MHEGTRVCPPPHVCSSALSPQLPGGGGGTHMLRAYGDVPSKWVTFLAKILRHGSHSVFKKSLEEGPISQKLQKKKKKKKKNGKISRFWREKNP